MPIRVGVIGGGVQGRWRARTAKCRSRRRPSAAHRPDCRSALVSNRTPFCATSPGPTAGNPDTADVVMTCIRPRFSSPSLLTPLIPFLSRHRFLPSAYVTAVVISCRRRHSPPSPLHARVAVSRSSQHLSLFSSSLVPDDGRKFTKGLRPGTFRPRRLSPLSHAGHWQPQTMPALPRPPRPPRSRPTLRGPARPAAEPVASGPTAAPGWRRHRTGRPRAGSYGRGPPRSARPPRHPRCLAITTTATT